MNRLKLFIISMYLFQSQSVLARDIESILDTLAHKGQRLLLGAFPIFAVVVGYLYKRGKPEAKEKLENLIIGTIIVMGAFGFSAFFR